MSGHRLHAAREHKRTRTPYLDGHSSADELDVVFLHVLPDDLGTLLVKAAQQNGANHDRHVQPDASQEPRTLQRHVGRTHTQRLARAVLEGEQVITGINKSSECSLKKINK